MAKLANEFSPEFCQRATPHLTRPFLGFYLETLVSDESPAVPPAIQRALNLQQNRKGDFTWKAA
jgi:hypothetical protein